MSSVAYRINLNKALALNLADGSRWIPRSYLMEERAQAVRCPLFVRPSDATSPKNYGYGSAWGLILLWMAFKRSAKPKISPRIEQKSMPFTVKFV
jgi:hypothetical protein